VCSSDLCKEYCDKQEVQYAEQHYEIIKKFDRFPHRNEILGRQSTPEELVYIANGDFPHKTDLSKLRTNTAE